MKKTNRQWYRERLALAGFGSYQEYLSSNEWRIKKKEFFDATGAVLCYICGDGRKLNVHHRIYKRICQENVKTDLVLLCQKCHLDLHEIEKQVKNPLRSLHRSIKRGRKFTFNDGTRNFIK